MNLTPAQHELIHRILERMMRGVNGQPGYLFIQHEGEALGYSKQEAGVLRDLMQREGLVLNHDGVDQNGISQLTPQGLRIAKAPGGYRAHVQEQADRQQAEQARATELAELQELRRQTAAATAGSTRAASLGTWLAAVSLLVALVAAYLAYQSSRAADTAAGRIEALEREVRTLQRQPGQ